VGAITARAQIAVAKTQPADHIVLGFDYRSLSPNINRKPRC